MRTGARTLCIHRQGSPPTTLGLRPCHPVGGTSQHSSVASPHFIPTPLFPAHASRVGPQPPRRPMLMHMARDCRGPLWCSKTEAQATKRENPNASNTHGHHQRWRHRTHRRCGSWRRQLYGIRARHKRGAPPPAEPPLSTARRASAEQPKRGRVVATCPRQEVVPLPLPAATCEAAQD